MSADATFYLATFVCLTSGIFATELPRVSKPLTSLQPPSLDYLPATNNVSPKLPRTLFIAEASDNGLRKVGASGKSFTEGQVQGGYSYLRPLLVNLELPVKDQTIIPVVDKQRLAEVQRSGTTAIVKPAKSSRSSIRAKLQANQEVEYQPHVPQRSSSYQVVEEHDEYLTNDSDHAGLPHRGKAQTTNPHRNSQDITTAIKALDHFLSRALNDDSYNSALHPPPNPVLALVLSRYGRYVPGARNPRVYAHMAVNNIHNNKPFGSYKLECDELPTYVRR
ncbi:uncharacterized protein LOC108631813 [Ceratina calcarata]|uniref:Uncharacterized protein LOC108631813 n=1 Tax=Ceratina calcarata TaxID=156304 RepID=A0AAJ7SBQ9_9HYME|nr:uncharacterized protein LOC108631813 [Ceratina calcarata]